MNEKNAAKFTTRTQKSKNKRFRKKRKTKRCLPVKKNMSSVGHFFQMLKRAGFWLFKNRIDLWKFLID
jgi:hypothetical protein